MTNPAPTPEFMYDGPDDGPVFALTHGAGALMDSPFMQRVAEQLADQGVRVVRFEFPYMAKRRSTGKKRPPDRTPVLLATWRAVIDALGGPQDLIIGGKSMGGRMASMIAAQFEAESTPVRGLACLGYPFHAIGKSDKIRIDHLLTLQTPTLILQGARDTMGWFDEVDEYPLPDTIQFHWLEDGDHDLKPRALSGRTMKQNQEEACNHLAQFILSQNKR